MFRNLAVQQLTEESDKMLVAPLRFKSVLLDEMDHVIAAARMGRPASMILKTILSATGTSSSNCRKPAAPGCASI